MISITFGQHHIVPQHKLSVLRRGYGIVSGMPKLYFIRLVLSRHLFHFVFIKFRISKSFMSLTNLTRIQSSSSFKDLMVYFRRLLLFKTILPQEEPFLGQILSPIQMESNIDYIQHWWTNHISYGVIIIRQDRIQTWILVLIIFSCS